MSVSTLDHSDTYGVLQVFGREKERDPIHGQKKILSRGAISH